MFKIVFMINEDEIWQIIDRKKDLFTDLSDRIFDIPEILYKEFESVSEHIKVLKTEGFNITKNFYSFANGAGFGTMAMQNRDIVLIEKLN